MDDRTPVLVGVAQLVEREEDPRAALEPAAMLERIARDAAADAGAGARLLAEIDTCALVDLFGWQPRNGPRIVAERVGARPRSELVSATGGDMSLVLLNHVAERIARGETRVALVAGCNNVRTLAAAHARKLQLDWQRGGEGEPALVGVNRWGSSEREQRYGLRLPVDVYPLFENALRARRGLDPDTHLRSLGRLMSRFTEVAAQNPYAWFPVRRSSEELVAVGPRNRMIAYPYPKYLNAVLATDQAAGCLLVSAAAARQLGVPRERWVWWWGGAKAVEDAWFPSERRDFHSSPALAAAARGALTSAGVAVDELDAFDFYSCFPVAVELACEALGLAEDDPRGFTVTGGLPYAGGPGSSYSLHAVAAMAERLRARPGAKGLVTGNGWYLTKHSAAVLATAPPPAPARPAPPAALPPPVALLDQADGTAEIETYTVVYDREGAPARGIVVGRLAAGGGRFLANTPDDRALLEDLLTREGVGRRGEVRCVEGANRFVPA
jgi:acetyl-CoA C-acetyltransferase